MKYWPSHRSDTFVVVDHPNYRIVEKDGRQAITCKRCGRTSHNPTDVRNVYCGNCHRFLLDPAAPADTAIAGERIRETHLTLNEEIAMAEMTTEQHRARHRELHAMLDELVADFIAHTKCLPSQTDLLSFMQWSAVQCNDPEEMAEAPTAAGGEESRSG